MGYVSAYKPGPRIGLFFFIKYCIFPDLLCCYRQIFHNQTFKFLFWYSTGIGFAIKGFLIFHSIQVFIQTIIIQIFHVISIPIRAEKVIPLITDSLHAFYRHFPCFRCHRLYSDKAASIYNLCNLRWLRHTDFIGKPAFIGIFPFFDPVMGNVAHHRLIFLIPCTFCTHNIHGLSVKHIFHSPHCAIIINLVCHYAAAFPRFAGLKKKIHLFIMFHIGINSFRGNRASCFLKFPQHGHFTVILRFLPLLLIQWKIIAFFPLLCSFFIYRCLISTLCFLFIKTFFRNAGFFSTGTQQAPKEKHYHPPNVFPFEIHKILPSHQGRFCCPHRNTSSHS